ncbi:MAG TPA: LacI family DNA-binding transcriptional regulator [Roseiflexaceae bacterium]|nr:LacI family DNA-binding transcriptional regulator [Roseiflexaceae bacterium]HMP40173.1 LacI family DNA-binding transcriptional regulator [Roseiflexaceae bacterium]
MRDVAQLAGVSTATVSHVINETRAVSEDLRGRVVAAMEALSYRPNAVARSLRVSETLTIGLIVPDVEIPFFARYARCIESAASEVGYTVILCNSNWLLENELRYLDHLLAQRVDGLICISVSMTAEHVLPVLRRNAPVIWLEEGRPGQRFDAVVLNNMKGAVDATTHLIECGHRRIGCITGPVVTQLARDRIQGYRHTLEQHGLVFDPDLMRGGDYTASSGYEAAIQLLERPDRPTAIFAFNDMMAIGAIRAINERGMRVPEDVAVIGFDGIGLTEHTCPPLSTIAQPIPRMSGIAISMLLERINGTGPLDSRTIIVDPQLIIRQSTVGMHALRHVS